LSRLRCFHYKHLTQFSFREARAEVTIFRKQITRVSTIITR